MSDVLSPAEIESLLCTMDETCQGESAPDPLTMPRGLWMAEKTSLDDFKPPERLGKDQVLALQSLHERFSRDFGTEMTALLRTSVEVKLTSVDQLIYSEFVFHLENPTCLNLIKAEPLVGQLILDINPSLLFPIIDRLLGGGKAAQPPLNRPLTEIELRLVGRVTDLFLNELRRTWEPIVPLELSVDRIESNPQLVQIAPPNAVVVVMSFELRLGEVHGMMNLCIPLNTIEPIKNRLSSNSCVNYSRCAPSAESIQSISDRLSGAIVEVVVDLAETNLSTADLIALRVGDIIATEQNVHRPLTVSIEGRPTFHASPGAYHGHKAIQLVGPIDERRLRAGN